MERFEYEKVIEDIKQPYLSIDLKQAPMYSKMVRDILQMGSFQESHFLMDKQIFLAMHIPYKEIKICSWK